MYQKSGVVSDQTSPLLFVIHWPPWPPGSPLALTELGYPAAAADSDKTALGGVLDRRLGRRTSGGCGFLEKSVS